MTPELPKLPLKDDLWRAIKVWEEQEDLIPAHAACEKLNSLWDELLRAYGAACWNAAIEFAAKQCVTQAWANKNLAILGPEMNCIDCAEAIVREGKR
jgi:hypothetical protein